jgi:glutamate-1-semialdehyde 2,1-aminomutase
LPARFPARRFAAAPLAALAAAHLELVLIFYLIPHALASLTVVAAFNDLGEVESLLRAHRVAAVIVEPVVGNGGFIAPDPAFLPGLRALADRYGALLVFDEVMTGFRVAYGGARERFGVRADLTTLGKVIGGGLPVAVYGGRRDLMTNIAPTGSVYQAGTLSGNPLAMAAGIATLRALTPELHDQISEQVDPFHFHFGNRDRQQARQTTENANRTYRD